MFATADRVKEYTSTSGTGTLTLTGEVHGGQSFDDAVLDGKEVAYCIYDPTTGDWEVTEGTYTASGKTLTRLATPLGSSNAGAKVNLAGNPETIVFLSDPAKYQYLPGNFNLGSILIVGVDGLISEDQNLWWDVATSTLLVYGSANPALRISEGGSTSNYLELVHWDANNANILIRCTTGNAHLYFNAVATSGSHNQVISFHDGAGGTTGYTIVEFHRGGHGDVNAVIGCDNVTNSYICGAFGKFGIGSSALPDSKVHVFDGSAGIVTAVANTVLTLESDDHSYISFLTPANGITGLYVGTPSSNSRARFTYDDSVSRWRLDAAGSQIISISQLGFGFGVLFDPAARMEIDTTTTTAVPCLKLQQRDLSEQFIEYTSTSAANTTNPISTLKSGGSIQGFVRQSINGTHYWMPFFSDPSSANPNYAEVSITAATTITATGFGKMHVISGTTANYIITLPAVSGNAGQILKFRVAPLASANKIYTLDANSTETIDGSLNLPLWALESVTLYCTGTEWTIIDSKFRSMKGAMYRNVAQSIPNNTHTQVALDSIEIDHGGLVDTTNNYIIIKRAGIYEISGGMESPAVMDAGEFCQVAAHQNSFPNTIWDDFKFSSAADQNMKLAFNKKFELAAGYIIMLGIRHNEGAAWNTLTGVSQRPFLSVIEIR